MENVIQKYTDSATLVNKCLELIEAHYLFDISSISLEILIHPEALVHSIVEFDNYVTQFNLFKNDMSIPLLNFLCQSKLNTNIVIKDILLTNIQI